MTRQNKYSVAIVGTGPAALMAADILSKNGINVELFEKRKSAGRKLLIAGSSGLNVSSSYPMPELIARYRGSSPDYWNSLFQSFSVQDWLSFLKNLGFETFEGSGHKFFIREMKASGLLKSWVDRLRAHGVKFHFSNEVVDFSVENENLFNLRFSDGAFLGRFDALCFALGGGSYEPDEKPLRWPDIFSRKGLLFHPFTPSNVGLRIEWSNAFLKEAEGKPLKNVLLSSDKGRVQGEIVVTRYGVEGTPVYSAGVVGKNKLDLKPEWTAEEIIAKCALVKENLAPLRRIKKKVPLSEAALALLFHYLPAETKHDLHALANAIKEFPLSAIGTQTLDESISAAGGLDMNELNEHHMIKKIPGVFAIGEMLDWDAPTGGFLIQACVSQGYAAGKSISVLLRNRLNI